MGKEWESGGERCIAPYVGFHGQPNAQLNNGERFDALGFRNPQAPTPDKPAGEIRICVLGGSTVVLGSSRQTTICGLLERRFHQSGFPQVRVYNFGAISAVSGQELALLTHTVADLAPDYVLVYSGGNDLHQAYNYDPRPGYPFNFFVWEATVRSLRIENEGGRINFYYEPFGLDLAGLRRDAGFPGAAWREAVRRRCILNQTKMRNFALGSGFRVGLFLQPMIHTKPTLAGSEPTLRGSADFSAYMEAQYQALRGEYAAFAQSAQVDDQALIEDMSDVFDGVTHQLYTDIIHVVDEGNDRAAARMFDSLRRSFKQFQAP